MILDEVTILRDLVDELREENRQLKELIRPPENPFYGRMSLRPQQAALLHAFYLRGDVPSEMLDKIISMHAWETRSEEPFLTYERARVAISTLRSKLRPYGIEIHTARGMGYRLDCKNRAKLEQLMEGWQYVK